MRYGHDLVDGEHVAAVEERPAAQKDGYGLAPVAREEVTRQVGVLAAGEPERSSGTT